MDIFQLIGDFLHLITLLMIILKILGSKNVLGNQFSYLGLSYKTQEAYLVVFLTRYIDLLTGWKSLYLFVMKLLFISLTAYTIYLMRLKRPYNLVQYNLYQIEL
jgi:ER lumen protein retaining receptor